MTDTSKPVVTSHTVGELFQEVFEKHPEIAKEYFRQIKQGNSRLDDYDIIKEYKAKGVDENIIRRALGLPEIDRPANSRRLTSEFAPGV